MISESTRQRLATMGIRYDESSLLHRDLASAVERVGNQDISVRNIALLWCYQAELERQIVAYGRAKTEYDRVLGAGVVRYRAQGEKSAEVAKMRAESEDNGVYTAVLTYRVAEGMIAAAKRAMDILFAELEGWRTKQANERAADKFQAATS